MVGSRLDLEGLYPDLFAPLDSALRRAVVQSIAAGWHEGWKPTREDVRNLVDYARGAIDGDEYDRRADMAARAAALGRTDATRTDTELD